jgi:hypothetical protein
VMDSESTAPAATNEVMTKYAHCQIDRVNPDSGKSEEKAPFSQRAAEAVPIPSGNLLQRQKSQNRNSHRSGRNQNGLQPSTLRGEDSRAKRQPAPASHETRHRAGVFALREQSCDGIRLLGRNQPRRNVPGLFSNRHERQFREKLDRWT